MNDINELREELIRVECMSEEEVCDAYNVDEKQEAIDMINEEINSLEYEELSAPCDYTDEELEQERTQLCVSQGISRFC